MTRAPVLSRVALLLIVGSLFHHSFREGSFDREEIWCVGTKACVGEGCHSSDVAMSLNRRRLRLTVVLC